MLGLLGIKSLCQLYQIGLAKICILEQNPEPPAQRITSFQWIRICLVSRLASNKVSIEQRSFRVSTFIPAVQSPSESSGGIYA